MSFLDFFRKPKEAVPLIDPNKEPAPTQFQFNRGMIRVVGGGMCLLTGLFLAGAMLKTIYEYEQRDQFDPSMWTDCDMPVLQECIEDIMDRLQDLLIAGASIAAIGGAVLVVEGFRRVISACHRNNLHTEAHQQRGPTIESMSLQ